MKESGDAVKQASFEGAAMGKQIGDSATTAPPATTGLTEESVVNELSRLWRELLGLATVGPDENYFDLGGDSILAVHLFAEIHQAFNVKLPVATLYEAPTISGLAGIICGQGAPSRWSPLVPIQTAGSRPPFFCMHGAGGNVLLYRALSKHLGADQPFYGLQSQGLDGVSEPLASVEEMAALYVREIKKVQRQGPYYLGGYCGGGTIAYEVAQQLWAAGEQVALLALFDTNNWSKAPHPGVAGKLYHEAERLAFHAANFFRLDFRGKIAFTRQKAQVFCGRLPVWRGILLSKFRMLPQKGAAESIALGRIWQMNDKACDLYDAKPYPGVVTDFRPLKPYRIFSSPGLKWGHLAQGGQRVIVLPVYPAGMMEEPLVRHLAAALHDCMDAVITQQRAS
jgi:thioesterase domain-containing protein/acyl carrier protein